jgi:soluble lytic murein transglycosylase
MQVPLAQRQEQIAGLPDARRQTDVGPDNFLGETNRVLLDAADRAGEQLNRTAADVWSAQLQEANQTRAQDAINQSQQWLNNKLYGPNGGLSNQGAAAFEPGADGKTPSAALDDEFAAHVSEMAGSLGNDMQQALYRRWAGGAQANVSGMMQQHEGQQYRVYSRGVKTASIDTAKQTVALNYNNPDLIAGNLDWIHADSVDLARLEGLPAETGTLTGMQHAGQALNGAIDSALAHGDHAAALRLTQRFGNLMQPNDFMRAINTVQKAQDGGLALAAVSHADAALGPMMISGDGDRLMNITFGAESSAKHWDDNGKVTSSPAGAIGIGQLLPATARQTAESHHIPWRADLFNQSRSGDPDQDAEAMQYNQTLSRLYLNQQLKKYGGDAAKAWAAYHAGPVAVDEAIGKANQQGDGFLSHLPKQTQDYVGKNLAAYQAGGGLNPSVTRQHFVEKALAALPATASADLRRQTRQAAERQFEIRQDDIKQQGDDAFANGVKALDANGGSFAALESSGALMNVPADKHSALRDYAGKVARGDEVKTDWQLYAKLMNDRTLLKQTNLAALKPHLADAEFKQLVERQSANKQPQQQTQIQSNESILKDYANQAGIETAPRYEQGKLQNQQALSRFGKLQSVFIEKIRQAETAKGRPLSEDEVRKTAANVFTPVTIDKPWWQGGDEASVAGLLDKTAKLVVPKADREEIIAKWQARYGSAPAEDTIADLYRQHLGL